MVIALRGRRQDPFWKRVTSRMYFWLFNYLAELDYNPEAGNFRIISRRVADNYRTMPREPAPVRGVGDLDGVSRPVTCAWPTANSFEGKSTYTLRKLFKLAFQRPSSLIRTNPLRLAVQFGAIISFLAFVVGLYVPGQGSVPGEHCAGLEQPDGERMYFLGGIIIAILGIIGVYLGKTFDEVKRRPLYIIADATEAVSPRARAGLIQSQMTPLLVKRAPSAE